MAQKAAGTTKKAAAKKASASKIPGLERFKETFAKSFGADTLQVGGGVQNYEVISTGSLLLDYATGIGGLPEGRLIEWWGPDGSGKTTMAFILAAHAQRKHPNKMVGFIDMEQAGDMKWAKALGVDVESETWAHVLPESSEEVADIMRAMLESDLFSLVILDSVGGMLTEEEKRKDAEDVVVGTNAKIVTRMVKMAALYARKSSAVVLILNQVRANIGGYGVDETTGGGWALRHATSMKMKFRRTQSGNTDIFKIGSGDEATSVGYETAILVEKNKCAPPKKRCTIAIFNQPSAKFGDIIGIDVASETANLTDRLDLLPKKGSWFIISDATETQEEDKVNGKPALVDRLRKDPDLCLVLRGRALDSVSHLVTDDTSLQGPAVEIEPGKGGFRKGAAAASGEDEGVDVLEGAGA